MARDGGRDGKGSTGGKSGSRRRDDGGTAERRMVMTAVIVTRDGDGDDHVMEAAEAQGR